jgi:parallel beta-helix repeat protein
MTKSRIGLATLLIGTIGLLATPTGLGAELSAAHYPSIQAALDALPPTGGRVFIPAGTYVLKGSLKPRSNVTISGAGPATVLKACDLLVSKTTAPIQVGDVQATVEDPRGFEVGMDVFAHKNIEWAPGVEKAFSYTITAIEGKTLKFDKPAAFAQPAGAAVCTGTPVILVFKQRNVVVENLAVDGNRKPNWVYVNLKMAGIYLWAASDCTVRNCHVINTSGDGIATQFPPTGYSGSLAEGPHGWATVEKHDGNGTLILNNRVRGASGFGIHVGGGHTKSIIQGNIVESCGWDGFYWCWDNALTIVTDNIFTKNGWNGIGGYGDGSSQVSDTQNINSNNVCAYNGYAGIAVTGGSGNIVSGNVCFANSRAAKGMHPGIKVSIPYPDPRKPNQTCVINTIVTGNSCNDVVQGAMQKCGIEVAGNVRGVVVKDNMSSGNVGLDVLPEVAQAAK